MKGNPQLLSSVVLRDIFTIIFASLLSCSPSTLTQSLSSPHKPALTAVVQYTDIAGTPVGQFHFLNSSTAVAAGLLQLIPWQEVSTLHYITLAVMLHYKKKKKVSVFPSVF